MASVPPAPLDRILPVFVEDLRETFRDELVGAYLYGSAISGGFDPAVSDLDVVIVTATPVDTQPFERFSGVIERLRQREPEWAGRLDLVFVGRSTLADFRSGGGPFIEISHDDGPALKHRADEWLETWYLARAADHPLVGPAASRLIPPISTDEFLDEVAKGVPWFIAAERNNGTDAWLAYRTLTLCRLLCSLESRELSSKLAGAAWAIDRYPEHAGLIRAALEVRSTDGRHSLPPDERAAIPGLLTFLAAEVTARRTQ